MEHVAAAGDAAVFTAPNGEPLISSEIVVEVSLAGLCFPPARAIPQRYRGERVAVLDHNDLLERDFA